MAAPGPFYVDGSRPFAQRGDTMALDIIHPKDVPRGKVLYCKDEDRSLKTEDIYAAKPLYHHLQYLDKPDLSVGCTEVGHAGGHARSYYPPMNRRPRDLSLTTADIEYAQPKGVRFRGNRHTDPVCPNYELPSSFKRELTPPRFNGRHTNDISDIELSRPKVLHPQRNYARDPNEARDIEFTQPNYQERMARSASTGRLDRSLNVKDISEQKRLPPRGTNPLEPVYRVATSKATSLRAKFSEEQALGVDVPPPEAALLGGVPGSKPGKLQWDNGEPQLSLMREDIAGAVPQRWIGSVPANIYDPPEIRPMVSFHDPYDIPGSQVGTLKKGLEGSRRCTNPLNPTYPLLDGNSAPQPTPVLESERGGMPPMHPLLRSKGGGRGGSMSLPNLRGHAASAPWGAGMPAQADCNTTLRQEGSQRFDVRDASDFGSQQGLSSRRSLVSSCGSQRSSVYR